MKVINYFILALLLLSIGTSCSNEVDSTIIPNNNNEVFVNDVEVVAVNGTKSGMSGSVLKFKDVATFERITQQLSRATTSERIAFVDSLGFISLSKLMKEADIELEALVESTSDFKEFSDKYQAYKQKYSMFLFNEKDKTDLSPYFPLENNLVANYVNENGQVMVGNELTSTSLLDSYEEKANTSTVSTYAEEILPVNNALATADRRKVGIQLSMTYRNVTVNFTSQKKSVFGWVRYSTIYMANFKINNFRWVREIPMTDGVPGYFAEIETYNQEFYYESMEQDGNYTFDLGYIKGGTPFIASGYAEIWSRGVPKSNLKKCNIEMIGHAKQ